MTIFGENFGNTVPGVSLAGSELIATSHSMTALEVNLPPTVAAIPGTYLLTVTVLDPAATGYDRFNVSFGMGGLRALRGNLGSRGLLEVRDLRGPRARLGPRDRRGPKGLTVKWAARTARRGRTRRAPRPNR